MKSAFLILGFVLRFGTTLVTVSKFKSANRFHLHANKVPSIVSQFQLNDVLKLFQASAATFLVLFSSVQKSVALEKPRTSIRPQLYSVEMTNPPSLLPRTPRGEDSAVERFRRNRIIILGHHRDSAINAARDSEFEQELLGRLLLTKQQKFNKNVIIGFDSISSAAEVQAALDNYIYNPVINFKISNFR